MISCATDPMTGRCAFSPNKASRGRSKSAAGAQIGGSTAGRDQVYAEPVAESDLANEVDAAPERYKSDRSGSRTGSTAGWWMPVDRPTSSAPEDDRASHLDCDSRRTRSMAQEGRSFTVTTATTVISRCTSFSGEQLLCAQPCDLLPHPYRWGQRDRWRNWNGSSAGFGRAGRRSHRHPGQSGFCRDACSCWCEDHHVDYVMRAFRPNDRFQVRERRKR